MKPFQQNYKIEAVFNKTTRLKPFSRKLQDWSRFQENYRIEAIFDIESIESLGKQRQEQQQRLRSNSSRCKDTSRAGPSGVEMRPHWTPHSPWSSWRAPLLATELFWAPKSLGKKESMKNRMKTPVEPGNIKNNTMSCNEKPWKTENRSDSDCPAFRNSRRPPSRPCGPTSGDFLESLAWKAEMGGRDVRPKTRNCCYFFLRCEQKGSIQLKNLFGHTWKVTWWSHLALRSPQWQDLQACLLQVCALLCIPNRMPCFQHLQLGFRTFLPVQKRGLNMVRDSKKKKT